MFPITRIRYRNAHTRKREERNEFYLEQKKLREIKRRRRIIAEMRKKGYRIDLG